jgi:uncharacterized protein involved in type VI secretion and phage assembly
MNSVFSIVRGQVTDNKDPENLGRVKVRFPFLGGKAKDNETSWCRVARPVSHQNAGDWILPDVGDEVLISFENNDLGRPIIVGSLYTETHSPPQTGRDSDFNKDGKNALRAIVTKSGHTLLFDDTSGKETVLLKGSQGHSLTFNKDGFKIETQGGEKITLKNKNSITIQSTQGHTLMMDEKGVQIQNKNGDRVELSDQGITIKTAQKVLIAGSSKIELGEGASKSLVFGEDLMQAFNSHTHVYAATTSMGTSNPPTVPMTPSILSKKVKTV